MDLGTAPLFDLPATPPVEVDMVPAEQVQISRGDQLLQSIKDHRAAITDHQLGEVRDIAEWALEHTVEVPEDASTLTDRGLDTGLPLAGEGAPLVSDFAVLELGAVLGRGIDSVRNYVGQVVELSHRLPQIWGRVLDGHVPVWKALRIADCTRPLGLDAVVFVDGQLVRFAATCSWAQVERLLDEAITRFDPDLAEARRRDAADRRHFDIDLDRAEATGTVPVHGELDLDDALDLEQALRTGARELASLGCTDSLDARRAMALGEMARRDLTLNYVTDDLAEGPVVEEAEEAGASLVEEAACGRHETHLRPHTPPGRTVDLHVHLSEAALSRGDVVGRLANIRTPVTAEQVREWCGTAARILVRPVIDVTGHEPVGAYEIAERQARQVLLRDQACVFPHCTRSAEGCDLDHTVPHAEGGVTCPCNLAPLCRGHHRVKTHHGWNYRALAPSVYYWRARTGHHWLITPGGTYALDTTPCPGPGSTDPPPE